MFERILYAVLMAHHSTKVLALENKIQIAETSDDLCMH